MLRFIIALCTIAFLCTDAHASVTVTVNGSNHTIPQTNEKGWGANVTAWIQAISSYTLQNSGGTFTLTAEVDTGSNYGFKVPYIKTQTSTPATAGVLRLARTDSIGWRNQADGANLALSVDSSNRLLWNGSIITTASGGGSFADNTFSLYDDGDATKLLSFQLSGISAGNTRTLTVPDASTTIVGTDTTQTLTGKTIDDDDNTVQDLAVTAFKTVVGQASTFLSFDGTGAPIATKAVPSGTVVGHTDTQTLTNKTIDADSNTLSNIENADIKAAAAIAVNKLAALTASRVVISDGSGFISAADTGTYPTLTELSYLKGVTSAIQTQLAALGGSLTVVSRDATDTVDTSENVILLTASGGAWTSTLYDASGNTGKVLRFIKTGNGTTSVTIDGDGTDTIGGVSSIKLTRIGDRVTIVSDGTNWQILDSKITAVAHYNTTNGYGSTNTKIRKYSTAVETTNAGSGDAFTASNDATDGLSITINLPGIYSFTYCELFNGAEAYGLSLNSSELTTDITSATASTVLAHSFSTAADQMTCVSWTGHLSASDVVRPHTRAGGASSVTARGRFHAQRVN